MGAFVYSGQELQQARGDKVALFVEVQPQLKQSLQTLANSRGESLSTVVRELLRNGIERRQAVTP